jgi:uncharacterized repeat protein (TIGR03803 family)
LAQNRFFAIAIAATVAMSSGLMAKGANTHRFAIIYTFQGGADGADPVAPLINIHGTLYGFTQAGGTCPLNVTGCGTVFSVTPAGVERVLYSFQDRRDGVNPYGPVKADHAIVGASSLFGGLTVLFSVRTDGKFRVLGTVKNPLWAQDRHPITEAGGIWYGVDSGTSTTNCANAACGFIYAIDP